MTAPDKDKHPQRDVPPAADDLDPATTLPEEDEEQRLPEPVEASADDLADAVPGSGRAVILAATRHAPNGAGVPVRPGDGAGPGTGWRGSDQPVPTPAPRPQNGDWAAAPSGGRPLTRPGPGEDPADR